jgi:glycosyltransferase involved in cell wall biosynthesis
VSDISLALVTRNQAEYLRIFLAHYLRHGTGAAPLIIVDDGSEDGTAEFLAALPQEAPITVRRIPHASIAHARNQALRLAATPWIAFSDTDCILGPLYFEALAALPLRFAGAAAVEGLVAAPAGPRPPFTHAVVNLQGGFFATANMAFHVPTVLALGGFDETRFGNYREDTDLALTLLEKKGPIPFHPALAAAHPYVPRRFLKTLSEVWAVQNRIIAAEIGLFEKHPVSYARVRRHRDARATLLSWCGKHFLSAARQAVGSLADTGLRGASACGAALVVAALEQFVILALCVFRVGKIFRSGATGLGTSVDATLA